MPPTTLNQLKDLFTNYIINYRPSTVILCFLIDGVTPVYTV